MQGGGVRPHGGGWGRARARGPTAEVLPCYCGGFCLLCGRFSERWTRLMAVSRRLLPKMARKRKGATLALTAARPQHATISYHTLDSNDFLFYFYYPAVLFAKALCAAPSRPV